MTGRAAVFLDRDGVLAMTTSSGGVPVPAASLAALTLMPGAVEACAALRALGYVLVLVTNQPEVARGRIARDEAELMNAYVRDALRLDDVRCCFHDEADGCECRKPKPGMILAAAHDLDLDLDGSFVVGDRWRDIGAGRAAGCRTILVGDAVEPEHLEPDERFRSLVGAVGSIAARHGGRLQATPTLSDLRIRIFADGADEATIARLAADPLVSGFTTNPTLMRSAGVTDYEAFARRILPLVGDRPISLEVFADDEREIEAQAREISSWGGSVYVKIPITDTRGRPLLGVIEQLSGDGIAINVTAVMTLRQVRDAAAALARSPRAYISIFAGRVADTGRDPVPIVAAAVQALRPYPAIELIWASPRELLNVFHADAAGCHIITVTQELLAKAALVGKDLDEYSLDTVKMFHRDAATAGYKIRPRQASGRATR